MGVRPREPDARKALATDTGSVPQAGAAHADAPGACAVPDAMAGMAGSMSDERRFGGIARLYGEAALRRLTAAHVVVVGVGGVGSWAAEALARSGVGRLTLIDLDHVAESNINRQVMALESTVGAAKVQVMAARCRDIAPGCRIDPVEEFVTADNVAALLPPADALIDAIDQPRAKAALIAQARRRRMPLVVCGGAGGRSDPLRLQRTDLALARGDALLASVRARLRREHGFPREAGRRFDVLAVHSTEPMAGGGVRPPVSPDVTADGGDGAAGPAGAPLACAGYGSIVTVTAALGLAAAQTAIDRLLGRRIVIAGVGR